jgi:polyferredoxin
MDNFILKSFRDQVQRDIERQIRIRNYFIIFIFVILLITLTYFVTKNISVVKYFFS